jgi:hypothetical protein
MGILDLAKQGDAQAIARLINRSLANKGVTALVRSRSNRLDIVLQAETVPAKAEFLPQIVRGLQNLGIQSVVNLYGRMLGEDTANWKQILTFSSTAPGANNLKAKSGGLAVNLNMSQLAIAKPTLKEYEDVVVRFCDRQGRVKCLTSLKELVQVLGRASFAYPAIAKDANLRKLLDGLAEFSSIDRTGRQLLTQASILRPGHNWQRVEIQIGTQLTFLPENESPAITVNVLEDYATPQAEAFARPAGSLLDEFGAALGGNQSEIGGDPDSVQAKISTSDRSNDKKTGKTSRAGDWLDEFGSAIEEENQSSKPSEIYAKTVIIGKSQTENLSGVPTQPKTEKPIEIIAYSPISGSFLDDFTSAIDDSAKSVYKSDSIQPKVPNNVEKLSNELQELIQIASQPLEQSEDDLFAFSSDRPNAQPKDLTRNLPRDLSSDVPRVLSSDQAIDRSPYQVSSQTPNQVSSQEQSQIPSQLVEDNLSSSSSADLFGDSIQEFNQNIELNQNIEDLKFGLPPKPTLPKPPISNDFGFDLFDNLANDSAKEDVNDSAKSISQNLPKNLSTDWSSDLFEGSVNESSDATSSSSLSDPLSDSLSDRLSDSLGGLISEPAPIAPVEIATEIAKEADKEISGDDSQSDQLSDPLSDPLRDPLRETLSSPPSNSLSDPDINLANKTVVDLETPEPEPILEQFIQTKPAPKDVPFSMEDLLAELQASSFIQPKNKSK